MTFNSSPSGWSFSTRPAVFFNIRKTSQVPCILPHVAWSGACLTPLALLYVATFGNTSCPRYAAAVDLTWSFGAAAQLPLAEERRTLAPRTCISHTRRGGHSLSARQRWLGTAALATTSVPARCGRAPVERTREKAIFAGWWLGHKPLVLGRLVTD